MQEWEVVLITCCSWAAVRLLVIISFAHLLYGEEVLVPVVRGDLYGYVGAQGRQWRVQPRYSMAYPFVEGRASVQDELGWTIINRHGEDVLKGSRWASVSQFSNGLARVTDDMGNSRYIDKNGMVRIDGPFLSGGSFMSSVIPVKLPKADVNDQRWVIIDQWGNRVGDFAAELLGNFVDGLAPFMVDGRWGVVSAEGDVILKPSYLGSLGVSQGVAVMKGPDGWEYIRITDRRLLFGKTFTQASLFTGGICVSEDSEGSLCVGDITGNQVRSFGVDQKCRILVNFGAHVLLRDADAGFVLMALCDGSVLYRGGSPIVFHEGAYWKSGPDGMWQVKDEER